MATTKVFFPGDISKMKTSMIGKNGGYGMFFFVLNALLMIRIETYCYDTGVLDACKRKSLGQPTAIETHLQEERNSHLQT
jgi:hypothetical protein